jgi:hypothetical protein
LFSINNDQPPGTDNLDGKILKTVADCIAMPICYVFNKSLKDCVCPQVWKEAEVFSLTTNSKAPFAGSNSCPISVLPVFSRLERNVFDQIQCYSSENNLTTDIQHAYREDTQLALTLMTDDWLKEMDIWSSIV